MVSKFQHHMEEGSFNRSLSDIEEIGDRVLQWGSHLDKKRVELRQVTLRLYNHLGPQHGHKFT